MAASMESSLLAAGAKGKRFTLPNAEVMIHQPLGSIEDKQLKSKLLQITF